MTNANKVQQYFCNFTWRNLLDNLCKEIDLDNLGYQIISPFGFELTENKKFLNGNLKRFYCYIGIPKKNLVHEFNFLKLSQVFSEKLITSLHKIGISAANIAILVTQDKFIFRHNNDYRCKSIDKLIDIQIRSVDDDILTDYAKYIICTVDSILSKKEEPSHFYNNKRHRCRTYQLYVMLEELFGYLLPPLSIFQKESLSRVFRLIDNTIQMFYDPSEIFVQANDRDIYLLNTLITPRVAVMNKRIKNHDCIDQLIKIKSDAYHVEGKLEVVINKKIYTTALNKIKTTYLNYL